MSWSMSRRIYGKFIIAIACFLGGPRQVDAACSWASQPAKGFARTGGNVTFRAELTGATGAVTHAWSKNGGAIANGGRFKIEQCGTHNQITTLTITNVEAGDYCDTTGTNGYKVTATGGGCGGPVESNRVALEDADDPNEIKDYSLKGYHRLKLTPCQIEAIFNTDKVNHTLDITKVNTATVKPVKPLHTTVTDTTVAPRVTKIRAPDCANPKTENCANIADFPGDCDRPAWLGSGRSEDRTRGPFQCYGNSYIGKWALTGTDGSMVIVALTLRKKTVWTNNLAKFDDINMIMHNTRNGETLWFNTRDGFIYGDPPRPATPPNRCPPPRPPCGDHRSYEADGQKIPAPHVAKATGYWLPPEEAAAITCINCHDNGPWMNSPWMYDTNVELIDRPSRRYVNSGIGFKDWDTPICVTVDAADVYKKTRKVDGVDVPLRNNACTSCHRISVELSTEQRWFNYTVGGESPWIPPVTIPPTPAPPAHPLQSSVDPGREFNIAYWMPDGHGIEGKDGVAAEQTAAKEKWRKRYKNHVDSLRICMEKRGMNQGAGTGDPCHVRGAPLPAPVIGPSDTPDSLRSTNVVILADTNGDGSWDYQSTAPSDPAAPPIVLTHGTPLTIGWDTDSAHPDCHISVTFPPGVEINGIGTGTNWNINQSPQVIGTLTVPGLYYVHIDCDDENYDSYSAGLTFKIEGPSPTVLQLTAMVDHVGFMAYDYPCYPVPANPHVTVPIVSPACVRIGWSVSNVVADSCLLTESFTPSGGSPGRLFNDESGFIGADLRGSTETKYVLSCTGLDGQPHSVDVTLPVLLSGSPVVDSDGDGTPDCTDQCPTDPEKTEPGDCGCGEFDDLDTDADGAPDCQDLCPNDPAKIAAGVCGCGTPDSVCGLCGTPDTDTDADGTPDCIDECPSDPNKNQPGTCGCGVPDPVCGGLCGSPDPDTDNDGVVDCLDGCPTDPSKVDPGPCGCGVLYSDSDGDGAPDCVDECPVDSGKTVAGSCGCGTPESECGCGFAETDTDGDLTPDCLDNCPNDPNKTEPGICGCGSLESVCGCGIVQTDSDCDAWPDCIDNCPGDPLKIAPGICGCGTPDTGDTRCFLPNNTCLNLPAACCTMVGGMSGPTGVPCAPPQACCQTNGTCLDMDPIHCATVGGTVPASNPSSRFAHAMAFDSARGVTVLFGGNTPGGRNGETWEWNGVAWSLRAVAGPSPRYHHAMAFDATRHVVVLFGGNTAGGESGETWEWNGIAWQLRAVGGPSARSLHAMAFDSARNVTVLFGGFHAGSVNGETWEWNGSVWTQRVVSGPSPRYLPGFCYDSARGRTVLFGGETCNCNAYSNETWEWNGTSWTQRFVPGPSARYGPASSYDSTRGVMVMFGGFDGAFDGETWEWNGTAWTQRVMIGPSPRFSAAGAFDSVRGVMALFGGLNGAMHDDTWEWDGAIWSLRVPAVGTMCQGDANFNGIDDACESIDACNCRGDVNGDTFLDGRDVRYFLDCLLPFASPSGVCSCADMNHSSTVTTSDVAGFVAALLTSSCGP